MPSCKARRIAFALTDGVTLIVSVEFLALLSHCPPLCHCDSVFGFSSSGSLAKFDAMRRASSRVSRLAADRRTRLLLEIEVAERLPGRVLHDEGLGVLLD